MYFLKIKGQLILCINDDALNIVDSFSILNLPKISSSKYHVIIINKVHIGGRRPEGDRAVVQSI